MAGKRLNGEGTVGKKGPPFIARFSYWDEDGKLKRVSRSGRTRKGARDRMLEAQAEFFGGVSLDAKKATVGEYLKAWLEGSVASDVSESTRERYEQDARIHIVPALGKIKLRELKPGDVERLKNRLLSDKGLAPGTANQCLVTLSVALNRAAKWELIDRNPAKAVKKAKDPGNGMVCLSEEEAGRLVEQAGGTEREALYRLASKCGLRQGELLALMWKDLETDKELVVRRSVDTNGPVPRWGATKGGEGRVIVLEPREIEALKRHRKMQSARRLALGKDWEDAGLIFPDEAGRAERASRVLFRLRKDLAAAGLPRVRFHDLRDTAATLMLSHLTPVHVVAKILGHKDPAMTLRRYAHVLPDAREEAARKMQGYGF